MTHNKHFLKHLGFASLIIIVSVLVIARGVSNSRNKREIINTTASKNVNPPGMMNLDTDSNQHIYKIGEKVSLILTADSKDRSVGGYDAVISYDEKILSYEKAENLFADFDFFSEEKNSNVSITGVGKITDTAKQTVFSKTPLARLNFIVKKADKFEIKLAYRDGATNDSNLVTADASDILGSVYGFVGYVGQSVRLQKGKSVQIPNSGLKITYNGVYIPPQPCADCEEKVTISIAQGEEVRKLEFISGGFDGAPFNSEKAFGMLFEVEEGYSTNSVTIRYVIVDK